MLRARTNDALVDGLIASGVLHTPELILAFRRVDRACFVPAESIREAYGNYPLPIRFGQTISQPTTVAFMLELVCPKAGERVLEIGSGSGYVLALVKSLVGPNGLVKGVERIPELTELAKSNLERSNVGVVDLGTGDGSKDASGPYDAIIVSAAASKFPHQLCGQLAEGGRLVVPVGKDTQDLIRVEKVGSLLKWTRYLGFRFVPLVED